MAQRYVLAVVLLRSALGSAFALFDEHVIVRPVPSRNAVTPPELARDAPRLDIAHPLEISLRPALRDDLHRAVFDGLDRRLRHLFGVDVPLVRKHRLDDDTRAIAERLLDLLVFDALQQTKRFDVGDHLLARFKAVEAAILRWHVLGVGHAAFCIHQDVEWQIVCTRDFVVVEIVRAGDLHRA